MNEQNLNGSGAQGVEDVLQRGLTNGDVAIAAARPILRHLLANRDQTLFSDEVIARIRGMISNIARQLLFARASADDIVDLGSFADRHQGVLAAMLLEDMAFLGHAHALTLEAQVAEQLQRRTGIDCVLTPLMQELAASTDPQTAELAMSVMAAQARFIQQTRRMELPLAELPGDLFHKALLTMRTHAGDDHAAEAAEARLRAEFDERSARTGQLARLVMGMGRSASRALAVDHAGFAIFATALAMATGQDRNLAIMATGENQLARLVLSLRAAGLRPVAVEEQLVLIHPDLTPPEGLNTLTSDRAAALLSASQSEALV